MSILHTETVRAATSLTYRIESLLKEDSVSLQYKSVDFQSNKQNVTLPGIQKQARSESGRISGVLRIGDTVKTEKSLTLVLSFHEGKVKMIIEPRTEIKVKDLSLSRTAFEVIKGDFYIERESRIDKIKHFFIENRYIRAALIGTRVYFSMKKNDKKPEIIVLNGRVRVRSKTGHFKSYVLNANQRSVGADIIFTQRDSTKYKGLGEGRIINTPTGPTTYVGGIGGIDNDLSNQGMFSGAAFPRFNPDVYASSAIDPEIQKIENRMYRVKEAVARLPSQRVMLASRHVEESDLRSWGLKDTEIIFADKAGSPGTDNKQNRLSVPSPPVPIEVHKYFDLEKFGFRAFTANLYDRANIGKIFEGEISNPFLARKCYGFHMGNQGNNMGDKVLVRHFGNGRVGVKNLVSRSISILNVRNTDR
ncbi:MAG: FecR domain-containing protein [Desulfococcaceae bacterium]|jgi:hypothetical protein|nr:FecR domain-containing protein [Desulfococcaceae bacterium]